MKSYWINKKIKCVKSSNIRSNRFRLSHQKLILPVAVLVFNAHAVFANAATEHQQKNFGFL
jgi:hypothetical protein